MIEVEVRFKGTEEELEAMFEYIDEVPIVKNGTIGWEIVEK